MAGVIRPNSERGGPGWKELERRKFAREVRELLEACGLWPLAANESLPLEEK